ncbi:hypothetical protein TNCV_542171 [Trichonephila clavipes]|nr:hypothetical protein TNCV_542171 [Trichonephila clavipes]
MQCRPLRYNSDLMRTWRNLGGRAKLASFLANKLAANLVTLATILASLATMLASSEPSGIFLKVVDLSTSVTFNDASGYISGSFYRAYKNDARRYGESHHRHLRRLLPAVHRVQVQKRSFLYWFGRRKHQNRLLKVNELQIDDEDDAYDGTSICVSTQILIGDNLVENDLKSKEDERRSSIFNA